ncbi:unnamed protein product [Moneuplotes crassus]|uniref:Uncharacterized protein n=1 Tax=Euplotes crassus TaxID=5936 RepID=A0AAD1XIP4_EUPCR|nr:unnamed protein product [Moneuplotes crassus]
MEAIGSEELPVFFSDEFNTQDFHIMEVDSTTLDKILDSKALIKTNLNSENPKKQTAALVTDLDTFKIKKLESSNSYYLSMIHHKEKNMEIYSSQNHVFICEKFVDTKAVELLLKDSMIYDSQLEAISTKGVTKNEILDTLQISTKQLDEVLTKLNAFEVDGKYYTVQEDFMLDTVKSMLLLLANSGGNEKETITLNDIVDQPDATEILTANLMTPIGRKLLAHVLKEAYDFAAESFTKNITNIAILSARILVSELNSIKLSEFIQTYENSLMVLLSSESFKELTEKHDLLSKLKNHDISILGEHLSIDTDTFLEKDYTITKKLD